jgi:hypothetical protein
VLRNNHGVQGFESCRDESRHSGLFIRLAVLVRI